MYREGKHERGEQFTSIYVPPCHFILLKSVFFSNKHLEEWVEKRKLVTRNHEKVFTQINPFKLFFEIFSHNVFIFLNNQDFVVRSQGLLFLKQLSQKCFLRSI